MCFFILCKTKLIWYHTGQGVTIWLAKRTRKIFSSRDTCHEQSSCLHGYDGFPGSVRIDALLARQASSAHHPVPRVTLDHYSAQECTYRHVQHLREIELGRRIERRTTRPKSGGKVWRDKSYRTCKIGILCAHGNFAQQTTRTREPRFFSNEKLTATREKHASVDKE